MAGHKYTVGETVHYTAGSLGRAGASGSFQIVRLLPSDGDDYQYRIKSAGEPYERVAKESQLDREHGPGKRPAHSIFAPEIFTTLAHFSMSPRR